MTTPVSRRQFLSGAVSAGLAGALGMPSAKADLLVKPAPVLKPKPKPTPLSVVGATDSLVLLTLYGGNDGLNTVIPYAEPAYRGLREGVAIPAEQVLPLGKVDGVDVGLHPSLVGTKSLFEAGHVAIILGVGYRDPNMSHFQSMDIWQTADPSGDAITGWLGRWLDATGADPFRALSVGPIIPTSFTGQSQRAGTLSDSTDGNAQKVGGSPEFVSAYRELGRTYHHEPGMQAAVADAVETLVWIGDRAATALDSGPPFKPVDTGDSGDIGNQLQIVAKLIAGGLPTKAYGVSMYGFDTHANQLNTQAQLLGQLDAAVVNFFGALPSGPKAANPVLLIHSEFGRRAEANASGGTDHGAANVAFVIGPTVKGGFYGTVPSLTRLDANGNIVYETDFRHIYATMLEQVLHVGSNGILGGRYPTIDVLR